MRERRYVKFKVDIYDDTKTKIIDQKPERDFIHYFFARSIILAGKADCDGNLYMAKNTPYTIETLAIEFGRDTELVELAVDLLIELKMIEVTEDNIYRVKNFVKHQNIKVKEKAEINDKEKINVATVSNREVETKEDKQVEDMSKEKSSSSGERIEDFKNVRENQDGSTEITLRNENQEITQDNIRNTDIAGVTIDMGKINTEQYTEVVPVNIKDEENIHVNSELGKAGNRLGNNDNQENIQSNSEQDNLVVLETKDNKKSKKKRESESNLVTELAVDEMEDDQPILVFFDGDMPPLEEGERLIWGQCPV